MPPQARRRSKQQNDDGLGMKIELDGRTYLVRENDLTPRDIRALRQETGFSWAGLGRELEKDPDIDLIAALVWMARRLDGEVISYDDVLGEMSYKSDLKISVDDKRQSSEGEAQSPEA
jgi:hypothetical protein